MLVKLTVGKKVETIGEVKHVENDGYAARHRGRLCGSMPTEAQAVAVILGREARHLNAKAKE